MTALIVPASSLKVNLSSCHGVIILCRPKAFCANVLFLALHLVVLR